MPRKRPQRIGSSNCLAKTQVYAKPVSYTHLDVYKRQVISIHRESGCVRVTVFNNGNPIPEKDLPNLWTKFYKVDKARTRAYGGSGIGLSIVKAIMEAHHQQYGVRNVEDGVEFWFTLDCTV